MIDGISYPRRNKAEDDLYLMNEMFLSVKFFSRLSISYAPRNNFTLSLCAKTEYIPLIKVLVPWNAPSKTCASTKSFTAVDVIGCYILDLDKIQCYIISNIVHKDA